VSVHTFLAQRPDKATGLAGKPIYPCLTCDGELSGSPHGFGIWWRSTPEADWEDHKVGRFCPKTRDRLAEARDKMIRDARNSPGPHLWDDAPEAVK